jgi:hypothetical protein
MASVKLIKKFNIQSDSCFLDWLMFIHLKNQMKTIIRYDQISVIREFYEKKIQIN